MNNSRKSISKRIFYLNQDESSTLNLLRNVFSCKRPNINNTVNNNYNNYENNQENNDDENNLENDNEININNNYNNYENNPENNNENNLGNDNEININNNNNNENNQEKNDNDDSDVDEDIDFGYYNDDDNYSNQSDDNNIVTEDDVSNNNNNNNNYSVHLPFSNLSGFFIGDIFNYNERIIRKSDPIVVLNENAYQSCAMTRAQIWEDFQRLKSKYNLSNDCCDDFILFMKKCFSGADLSNVINLQYDRDDKSEDYFFDKYFRKITVDVCINGCVVYMGDYEKHNKCLFCSEPRYHNKCKTCTNQNNTGQCTHSYRRSKKTVEYRSIIMLLKDLISSHPSFLDLIQYNDYGFKNDPEREYFKDNKDGNSYKRNMVEMRNIFLRYKEQRNDKSRKLIEISLCLSWFYDGCQLYHHLIYSFLPLIFTILNLPPNLRNDIGIGTFLLFINTLTAGSYAEFFLLFDCFVQELLVLYNGISVIVDDIEFFLQCRLICSILDLPALCKVFWFQSMFNSQQGCVLCNWGGGTYFEYIGKVKYVNSRLNLPLRHYLRSLGFKICDCAPEKGKSISECEIQKFCNLWDPRIIKWTVLFNDEKTRVDLSSYIWYNQDIADIDEIGMTIKNEHAFKRVEYKVSLPYKRHDTNYYDDKASSAIELKKKALSKSAIQKISVNGIKGFSPLRALPYINYKSDICQDPAHVLFVLALMVLNIWSCDKENYRMFKSGVKEYYKNFDFENVFDCLWDQKVIVPWNFNKSEQLRAQAYMKCLLIPSGAKSKFKIVSGNIFKQKGIIKGSGKITIISVFTNLLLFANWHMSIGYKAVFRIFSNIFSRVRNKKIFKSDIFPLFRRCNELRSTWEGLIPITEMIQMLHALEDISMHISEQGPIAGFNAMKGEQAIGFVKNLCHVKGSSRPELAAFKKVAAIEFNKAKTFYSQLDSDRTQTNSNYLYWNKTSESYVYNIERNLLDGFNNLVKLNPVEFSCLLVSFHRIILKYYKWDKKEAIENSSLFRILCLFKSLLNKDTILLSYFKSLLNKYEDIINDDSKCDSDDKKYRNLEPLKIFKSKPNDVNYVGIIESDLDTIRNILKFYEEKPIMFTIYTRVILPFSIQLRGRGFEYSENNKNRDEIRNSLNNLEEHFYEKNQYSSWCKIEIEEDGKSKSKSKSKEDGKNKIETEKDNKISKTFYGQANYFFQLPLSFDDNTRFPELEFSILKNINFASVTTYTYDCHKIYNDLHHSQIILSNSHLNTINISNGECNNMVKSNPSFITLNEILPTEVLTFAFIHRGMNYKAIYPYCDYNSPLLDDYIEKFMISLNDEFWYWKTNWHLAFIDGSPENLVKKENKDILEEVEYEHQFWETISKEKEIYKYW